MRDPYHDPKEDPYEHAEQSQKELLALLARPAKPGVFLDVDVPKAGIIHLLLLIPAALLSKLMIWLPLGLRRWMLTIFGISAMVSPLLLWMAVTKWLMFGILGNALISIGICCAIVVFSPEDQL